MKKRIAILLRFQSNFYLLESLVVSILKHSDWKLFFLSDNAQLNEKIIKQFNKEKNWVIGDLSGAGIEEAAPDLVINVEPRTVKFNEIYAYTRQNNIPVLVYDHGALLFKSYYINNADEYTQNYRSDLVHDTYIACWNKRHKDCFLTYGNTPEKFIITGALQNEKIFFKKADRTELCQRLNIDQHSKIILYFIKVNHPSINKEWNDLEIRVLNKLKKFTATNTEYSLVIKPHPNSMIRFDSPVKELENCVMVANQWEKKWAEAKVVDINELISISEVVVSTVSSVLIVPLALDIPIVHVEIEGMQVSKEFSEFIKKTAYIYKNNVDLDKIITEISLNRAFFKSDPDIVDSMCYKHTGHVTENLLTLIKQIFKEQLNKKNFYPLTIEQEYLKLQEKFPELPYHYQNLVRYYSKNNDFDNAVKWMDLYIERFKNPQILCNEMVRLCFAAKIPDERKRFFCEKYFKLNLLDIGNTYRMGIIYRYCRNYNEAIHVFKTILHSENNVELKQKILYETGLVYTMQNKLKKAIEFYKEAVSITNTQGKNILYRIYFRLGSAFFLTGRHEEAKFYLEQCLKLCPEHREADNLLKEIRSL